MIKVILDTNIVISGYIWGGTPGKVLAKWSSKEFSLVISPKIVEEYAECMERICTRYKQPFPQDFLSIINLYSISVPDMPLPKQVCEDPDDDKFLAAALTSNAKVLVTGDKLLLKVKDFSDCKIITAAEFLKSFF